MPLPTLVCSPIYNGQLPLIAANSLTSRLSRTMPQTLRERGSDYFAQRRVSVYLDHSNRVHGFVAGRSGLYEVLIERQGDDIDADCTCPYFEENEICKHVWATALEAERGGTQGSGGRLPKPVPPAPPKWHRQVDALGNIRSAPVQRTGAVPPHRRILYVLAANSYSDCLEVSVYVVQPKATARDGAPPWGPGWRKPRPVALRRDEIESLPDAMDVELLTTLTGGQDLYFTYTHSLQHCRVTGRFGRRVVQQLVATGRCFSSPPNPTAS